MQNRTKASGAFIATLTCSLSSSQCLSNPYHPPGAQIEVDRFQTSVQTTPDFTSVDYTSPFKTTYPNTLARINAMCLILVTCCDRHQRFSTLLIIKFNHPRNSTHKPELVLAENEHGGPSFQFFQSSRICTPLQPSTLVYCVIHPNSPSPPLQLRSSIFPLSATLQLIQSSLPSYNEKIQT